MKLYDIGVAGLMLGLSLSVFSDMIVNDRALDSEIKPKPLVIGPTASPDFIVDAKHLDKALRVAKPGMTIYIRSEESHSVTDTLELKKILDANRASILETKKKTE